MYNFFNYFDSERNVQSVHTIKVRGTFIKKIFFLACLLSLLPACASLNPENMVIEDIDGKRHKESITLIVGKTSRGEGWYSGSIKPEQFEQSIRDSIEKTELFESLTSEEQAKYSLQVSLTYAGSHPGFNMTAWVNAEWSLIKSDVGETVWSKHIEAKGRATVGEAFSGAKRQYMALERAGKANINEALQEISKLNL